MAIGSKFVLKTLMATSVGLTGLLCFEMIKSAEPAAAATTDFTKAHRVILPAQLELVPPGVYSEIEVITPSGKKSCNASVAQSGNYRDTRQVMLSDCKPL